MGAARGVERVPNIAEAVAGQYETDQGTGYFPTHVAHTELPPLTGSTSPGWSGLPWNWPIVPAVEVTGGSIVLAQGRKDAFPYHHRSHS